MLTGDNLWTGVFVAQKSGLIPPDSNIVIGELDQNGRVHWRDETGDAQREPPVKEDGTLSHDVSIVLTGDAWQELLLSTPKQAMAVLPFIRVVGRCSPLDKVSVVDAFVAQGHKTLMCGDGGNDCGSLKAAHVGIALSDSDASVVAPFTSLDKDISSVISVILEGRSALASVLAVYKYIIMYGNASSTCQVIMYSISASFSEWMWLMVDGFYVIIFSLLLPLSTAARVLSPTRPTSSLLSWTTIGSVLGMVVINYTFIAISFFVLYNEDWFLCRQWDPSSLAVENVLNASDNYEMSVLYIVCSTQVLAAAFAMNFGHEFRQAWYRNFVFVAFWVTAIVLLIYALFVPGDLSCVWRINCTNEHVQRGAVDSDVLPIGNPFNTTVMPIEFRWKLFGLCLANLAAICLNEYCVVNGLRKYLRAKRLQAADGGSNNNMGPESDSSCSTGTGDV